MNVFQRFTDGIKVLTAEEITIDEIGYETLWFEKEEIDESLITLEILNPLEEPIVTTSVDYTDKEGDYYLFLVIDREAINMNPYEVWLKNGEIIKNPLADG